MISTECAAEKVGMVSQQRSDFALRVRSILRCVMFHSQLLQASGLKHMMHPGHPCHVTPDHTVSAPSSCLSTGILRR